jgi:O-acetyl-ADP-ribose deacetylase
MIHHRSNLPFGFCSVNGRLAPHSHPDVRRRIIYLVTKWRAKEAEMTKDARIGSTRITLVQGDITVQAVDAIVNAANSSLMGGGGVDGAIHRAGGPEILEACKRIRETSHPDGLPAGEAVATTAGKLPARRVIHTVGPRWKGGERGERETLASAYRTSLDVARDDGLRSVAFPAISTGAYGYPKEEAAEVAIETVRGWLEDHPDALDEVRFVLFDGGDLELYRTRLLR